VNLALDPGTYLYNAAPPWDNTLTHTGVHNTVLVDGQEQMSRAGRFLYLNWAQTQTIPVEKSPVGALTGMAAQHNGYRRLGITHQRQVSALQDGGWLVQDTLLHKAKSGDTQTEHQSGGYSPGVQHCLVLHWLLPDCPWQVQQKGTEWQIHLDAPGNPLVLSLRADLSGALLPSTLQISHAGELLYGSGEVHPTWGWTSPAYGVKIPALSLRLSVDSSLPLVFTSRWTFRD